MPIAAPKEAYCRIIAHAQVKTKLRWDQLILQSCAAGFWTAIYGHAIAAFASSLYVTESPIYDGLTRFAAGILFPGAWVAIVYTGSELFTANIVTMFMLWFHEGEAILFVHMLRVWGISFLGNGAAAIAGAFFLTYLSREFASGKTQKFLFYITAEKMSRGFGTTLILGILGNSLVCLAAWCVACSDDGGGRILALLYSITLFIVGGFEHILLNFYFMTAAAMCGYRDHSIWDMLYANWIPVLIGNILAGTVFTGVLWTYTLHPDRSDVTAGADTETNVLTKRLGSVIEGTEAPEDVLRWRRQTTSVAQGMLASLAPVLIPAPTPSLFVTSPSDHPPVSSSTA